MSVRLFGCPSVRREQHHTTSFQVIFMKPRRIIEKKQVQFVGCTQKSKRPNDSHFKFDVSAPPTEYDDIIQKFNRLSLEACRKSRAYRSRNEKCLLYQVMSTLHSLANVDENKL